MMKMAICYKDMTFCNAECDNKECHLMYTEEVQKSAAKWWGSDDAPIAISDFSKGCTVFIKKEQVNG
jgi:hypothetical protein